MKCKHLFKTMTRSAEITILSCKCEICGKPTNVIIKELQAENKKLKLKIKTMNDFMKPLKQVWDKDNVWDKLLKDK